jgi:hypothetical protein
MTPVPRSAERRRAPGAVGLLMIAQAASLGVMSALHLPDDAGIAEAVIAVVLLTGAAALGRGARILPPLTVGFAIAGFLVGLRFTLGSGDAVDLAYHATVLPLLIATLVALIKRPSPSPGPAAEPPIATGAAETGG